MSKMRKYQSLVLAMAFFITGCSTDIDENKKEEKVVKEEEVTKEEKPVPQNEPNEVKEESKSTYIEHLSSWTDNKIQTKKYSISGGKCGVKSMTAPDYVDDNGIAFVDSQETQSRIMLFDRKKGTCQPIYKTNVNDGIGNLTGEDGFLYWSEYDTRKMTDVDWKIKSLNLSNLKVSEIDTGGSYFETPTPAVRIGDGTLSWVKYTANEKTKTIQSQLMFYDTKLKKLSIKEKDELDESQERKGSYHIIQENLDSKNYLLYKSVFKDGEKKFTLNLNEDGEKSKVVATEDGIIDFTYLNDYVTYTNGSSLYIYNKNKLNQAKIFKDDSINTTLDTPIFINEDTLIFRRGMEQIYILNIAKGIASPISESIISTSKPIYTNEILSYSVFENDEDQVNLDFYVVKIQ